MLASLSPATFSYLDVGEEQVESWCFDGGRVGVEAQHTGRRARKLRVPVEGVNPGWIRKEVRTQTR